MSNGRHSYVPFYPSDWLAGTARLPRLHRSVFFDVCCYIWDAAKPVPARELVLMLSDVKGWQAIVEDLVASGKLDRGEDGSLSNARAMIEAIKAQSLWESKSKGGKAPKTPPKTVGKTLPKSPPIEPEPEPEPEPREEEAPKKALTRATFLPKDFAPVLTARAQANWDMLDDPEGQLERFKDHARANARTAADWQAALRTWLTDSVKRQKDGYGRGTNGADKRDGVAKAIDRHLGSGGASGAAGRRDAGDGEADRRLPAPGSPAVQ